MSKNVKQCQRMSNNVKECQTMSKNVKQCQTTSQRHNALGIMKYPVAQEFWDILLRSTRLDRSIESAKRLVLAASPMSSVCCIRNPTSLKHLAGTMNRFHNPSHRSIELAAVTMDIHGLCLSCSQLSYG